MKKITVFVLSIVALASAASAQIVTKQNDFTNNCDAFKGQTIIIDGVNLRPKQAVKVIAGGNIPRDLEEEFSAPLLELVLSRNKKLRDILEMR